MKTWVRSTLFALGMIGVVAVGTAQAQVTEPIKFTTAFPFRVGGVTLPAGSYTVRPLDGTIGVMEISHGREAVFFDAIDAGIPDGATVKDQVVFTKVGGTYVLEEILDATDHSGVEPATSVLSRHRR